MTDPNKSYFKIIAPFRGHLSIDRPKMALYKKEFNKFMNRLSERINSCDSEISNSIPKGVSINVNTSYNNCSLEQHYNILNSNGSDFKSPHILQFNFSDKIKKKYTEMLQKAAQMADEKCGIAYSEVLQADADSIELRTYDLTISIFAFNLVVNEEHESCTDNNGWDTIDSWIGAFTQFFINLFYQKYIYQILISIAEFSKRQEHSFFLLPDQFTVCRDMVELSAESKMASPLMWSSTTLAMPKNRIDNNWVKSAKHEVDQNIDSIEGADLHINWGNDVYEVTDPDKNPLDEIWKGVEIAHFYYAKFDIINNNLTTFVGQVYSDCSNKTIHDASSLLENVITSINVLKLDYKDGIQELREVPRFIFERLFFDEWDIDNMLKACDIKLKLCEANLSRLNHTINTRSSGRVQLVLTLLAALGIVNLMVSVSSTARTLEMYNILERGILPGIMDIALYLSPDTMAWFGCILGLAAGAIIMANRPR